MFAIELSRNHIDQTELKSTEKWRYKRCLEITLIFTIIYSIFSRWMDF